MQKQNNPWIDLKKLRELKGWSQNETAKRLGFSRCYLSNVETGSRNISLKMMGQIIKVFNVKYDDFYSNDDVSKSGYD